MHFLRNVALFALTTRAHSLIERDFATAQQVISDIQTGFKNIDDAATAFNGDSGPLKAAAQAAIDKMDQDITVVQNMTPLNFAECYNLVTSLKLVQQQGNRLEKTLLSRKNEVQQYKECATVYGFLDQALSKSSSIISVMKSKVPANTQRIIDQVGGDIVNQVTGLRDSFSPSQCVNAS